MELHGLTTAEQAQLWHEGITSVAKFHAMDDASFAASGIAIGNRRRQQLVRDRKSQVQNLIDTANLSATGRSCLVSIRDLDELRGLREHTLAQKGLGAGDRQLMLAFCGTPEVRFMQLEVTEPERQAQRKQSPQCK